MALQAIINRPGAYRIVLEEYPEGVCVLVYESADDSDGPCRDNLQDDWPMAKLAALQDYGVAEDQWCEVPDTRFMGEAKGSDAVACS